MHRASVALVLIASLMGAARTLAQTGHREIVTGRVTDDSSRVITDATVIATRVTNRGSQSATTDRTGRFSIDWPSGSGEYAVQVFAAGYVTVARRVVRMGADSVITADFQLTRQTTAQRLAAVVTRATRPQPTRDLGSTTDIGASDNSAAPPNVGRRLARDQAGDLAALAALAPGVMQIQGGISVLGLGAAQNATTLNGLALGTADIPRDAFTRVRVTSSTYDPSIGWFSGARTQVDLAPGEPSVTARTAHLTIDAPIAQWTDPVSAKLGQRFTNVIASMGGIGQIAEDSWTYNYGVQGGRKTSDFASIATADALLLRRLGVSGDSVVRFTDALHAASVPSTPGGVASVQIDDNVSFIGRIDHAPFEWKTVKQAPSTWSITGYAKASRQSGLGLGPTSTGSHAGKSSLAIASMQGEWSKYFQREMLADMRSSLSLTRSTSTPSLSAPDGRVLVASSFADGAGGVSDLQFGGNAGFGSSTRNVTWESVADVQLYPPGNAAHKVRLGGDLRFDASTQATATNTLGTFSFNSLADLSANRPASFTRALNDPARRGGAWNAFGAFGDVWRVSPNLVLKYGVRAEGNIFTDVPTYNPAVEQTFGARTDHAPNTLAVSPRVGFQYSVPGADGRPSGTLRGGVGRFRNLIDPSLLANASVMTGLRNGAGQLACYGAAVPAPDWSAYASDPSSIPQRCADGAGATFADAAPSVRLFDPHFSASQSWRGNVAWSASALRMPYSIEATLSRNLDQRGNRELNFSGLRHFTSADEERPIYASPQSIVSSTGVVSPVDARLSSAFGRVTQSVSDLRSESRQLTFTLRPYFGALTPNFRDVSLAYTAGSIREESRGFDQSTFGDPSQRDWARGALDARHQFVLQGVVRPHAGWQVFFSGHLQSGTPYTPMIRGDVNGDALANDRAFVFDPAHTADANVAGAMRTLLATTSSSARDCLTRQLALPAGRNSCNGPWSATLNAAVHIDGSRVLHNDRVNIAINLANPLGGVDQALHGSDNLHGWGARPVPDNVLLDVRGFDPVANRFQYAVNPRFGMTSATNSATRAPFRLTLDVSVNINRTQTSQAVDKLLQLGRGGRSGARLSAMDLAVRFQRTVPDPYAEVLQEADSLLLTSAQSGALRTADARYRQRLDSIWTDLSGYLASLTDAYPISDATRRVESATEEAWEITRQSVQQDYAEILTRDQLTMLPSFARTVFESSERVRIRLLPH